MTTLCECHIIFLKMTFYVTFTGSLYPSCFLSVYLWPFHVYLTGGSVNYVPFDEGGVLKTSSFMNMTTVGVKGTHAWMTSLSRRWWSMMYGDSLPAAAHTDLSGMCLCVYVTEREREMCWALSFVGSIRPLDFITLGFQSVTSIAATALHTHTLIHTHTEYRYMLEYVSGLERQKFPLPSKAFCSCSVPTPLQVSFLTSSALVLSHHHHSVAQIELQWRRPCVNSCSFVLWCNMHQCYFTTIYIIWS